MIAPVISQLIDDKNAPLTPLSMTAAEVYEQHEKTEGMYLPPPIKFGGFLGTWTHRLDARIVGLYESGGLWAKNTFHPTGVCKMRNSRNEYWPFCPVCRYILAEFIDPSAHAAIDAEYAKQYPTKI
jgi:hypothetical protein